MADARAPAQPSPLSERVGVLLASVLGTAFVAFCLYGAFNGELQLPTRSGPEVVVRGWAAWVFCLVPVLAFSASIAHFKHRAGRLGNKALLAVLIGSLIAMMAVIWITVPGPINPFGITQ